VPAVRLTALLLLLATAPGTAAAVHDLAPVAAFHYQLQNLDVAAASGSPFPLLVTDYSFDGSVATELSPADVASLRSGGRKVLAYLSIGEAETYRFYWNPAWTDEGKDDPDRPPWLGPVNPQFRDNIDVRYWDPAWQAIVFGSPGAYLDRILAQGFDGAYLDIVDAYELWGPDGNGERPTAAADMRSFVEALAAYARTANPAFAIVPQNGSALVSDPTYLAAISGQGGEDTWFRGDSRQSRYQAEAVVPSFDAVKAAGKAVLLIDYPGRASRIADFFDRAEAKGYGAYNSTRALDRMTVHPEHPPAPAPTVALVSPADGASASATTAPTFTWAASGATGYELHFSGTSVLTKVRRLPRRKTEVLTVTSHTPAARDWARLAREARKGDGVTLYWWAVAVDGSGARRSTALRSLVLVP
jgi:cysteinyl-tRNA synthetase